MKYCKNCNKSKSLGEFWNHAGTSDGKQIQCKLCLKISFNKYKHTDRHRILKNKLNKLDYHKNPEKKRARDKVYYALEIGRLVKKPCEIGGELDVQAHHNWGYEGANALRVMWLCDSHHKEKHKNERKSKVPPPTLG